MSVPPAISARPHRRRHLGKSLGAALLISAVVITGVGLSAQASSVTTATFTGGAGTVSSGGTLYAKQGGALTLTVVTSSDTTCVEVKGAFIDQQTSPSGKSTWTFTTTAGAGDGVQAVTAAASPNVNTQGKCTGQSTSQNASYTLDNTGPTLTAAVAPAPNAAGWRKADTTLTWSATDAGSGLRSGPTPANDTVTSDTAGVVKAATATDNLGNSGSGSVFKLDKTAPVKM